MSARPARAAERKHVLKTKNKAQNKQQQQKEKINMNQEREKSFKKIKTWFELKIKNEIILNIAANWERRWPCVSGSCRGEEQSSVPRHTGAARLGGVLLT